MLIAATPMIRWNEYSSIEDLGETDRGNGGFGSTDKS
jgi:dUTPase